MKNWHPLTDKFTAENGLVVEPVASQEALIEIGTHFNNGLSMHHDAWASMCQRGKRQIFCVRDDDDVMVACGELEVRGGAVKAMFVRGHANRDFGADEPEFTAVSRYLEAVNGKEIDLKLEVGEDGFAAGEKTPSLWDRAIEQANEQGVSPFSALLASANDPIIDPDADPVEDKAWAVLTGPFTHENGYTVEPVGSLSGLRTLGEELENCLFVMHNSYASYCAQGTTQFAAIYTKADGIVAMAELRAAAGQIVPSACRGRFDEEAPAGAQEAVLAYVAAVNGRTLETNVAIGANGFAVEGAQIEVNPLAGAYINASPTLMKSARNGGIGLSYDGNGQGFDDWDSTDDDDEDYDYAEDSFVSGLSQPLTWRPLTERFVADNGLAVTPVANQETLRKMGVQFNNALKHYHRVWAEQCQQGGVQILRITGKDDDWMVANAEVSVDGDQVKVNFNRCDNNADAPADTMAALTQWVEAVNERRIDLNGEVKDGLFVFDEPTDTPDEPTPAPGM